jgi:hypothetical protein
VRRAGEEMVCVVITLVGEAGGGRRGIGYDGGILGSAEHRKFAGKAVDLVILALAGC